VVAEEVRGLAQRSAAAARDTAAKIGDSVRQSALGVAIVGEVASSFSRIGDGSAKVGDLIENMDRTIQKQVRDVRGLESAVSRMDAVIQRDSANAEESAGASQELASQALLLREMAGSFRIGAGTHTTLPSHASAKESHFVMLRNPSLSTSISRC